MPAPLPRRHDEFVLYSGSLEHYFNREFHRGAAEAAGAGGLELRLVEFPKGVSSLPLDEQRRVFAGRVELAAAQGWGGLAGIAPSVSIERLGEALAAAGLRPRLFVCRSAEAGLARFHDAIYDMIAKVVARPSEISRVVAAVEQETLELAW